MEQEARAGGKAGGRAQGRRAPLDGGACAHVMGRGFHQTRSGRAKTMTSKAAARRFSLRRIAAWHHWRPRCWWMRRSSLLPSSR